MVLKLKLSSFCVHPTKGEPDCPTQVIREKVSVNFNGTTQPVTRKRAKEGVGSDQVNHLKILKYMADFTVKIGL